MVPTWLHFPAVDGVYWTLAVEIQFYALVWVLILTRQLRYIERWLTAGLALTLVAFCAGAELHALRSFSPFFISGACLYLIHSQGPSRWRFTLLSASATLGVYQAITHQANATHLTGAGPSLAAAGLVLLMHGVFLAVALRKLKLPTSPVWYWLGCLTYPLYLLHNVSGRRFFWLLPDTLNIWLRWTLMLIAIFAAAFIFAALIERRACGRFNRFLTRVAQSVAAGVSPVRRQGPRKLTANN